MQKDWTQVINAPILSIHPMKDEPARNLTARRKSRNKRTIIVFVLAFLFSICIIVPHNGLMQILKAPLSAQVVVYSLPFLVSILMFIIFGGLKVTGGNQEDYKHIQRSLIQADVLLFGNEPGQMNQIYTIDIATAKCKADKLLRKEALKLEEHQKQVEAMINFIEMKRTQIGDASGFFEDLKEAIAELDSAALHNFKVKYNTLRRVGLGEESIDVYFASPNPFD